MLKKILSIFIVLAMFSFMGCIICSASKCSNGICCKLYEPVTIEPGQTAKIRPCKYGGADCCKFIHSQPKFFKVWSDNPSTNFTIKGQNAIGSYQFNVSSINADGFEILNNANLSDTFFGNLEMEPESSGGAICLGYCECKNCPDPDPDPDPKPAAASTLKTSIGTIVVTILGLLAL